MVHLPSVQHQMRRVALVRANWRCSWQCCSCEVKSEEKRLKIVAQPTEVYYVTERSARDIRKQNNGQPAKINFSTATMTRFDLNNLPEHEEDIDFTDIEERYQLSFEEGFDNVVVVDNIPLVDETKEEKLVQFLRKIFKNVGEIRDNHFVMPKAVNEKGKLMSKG